jgi:hypothetical protein
VKYDVLVAWTTEVHQATWPFPIIVCAFSRVAC